MTHIKVYILVYFPSTRGPTMLEKPAHPGGGSGIGLGLRKRHSMSFACPSLVTLKDNETRALQLKLKL